MIKFMMLQTTVQLQDSEDAYPAPRFLGVSTFFRQTDVAFVIDIIEEWCELDRHP